MDIEFSIDSPGNSEQQFPTFPKAVQNGFPDAQYPTKPPQELRVLVLACPTPSSWYATSLAALPPWLEYFAYAVQRCREKVPKVSALASP
jgi:hypothetical protein